MAVFVSPRGSGIINAVGVIYPGNGPITSAIQYRYGFEEVANPSGTTLFQSLNGRFLSESWSEDDTPIIDANGYNTAPSGNDAVIYLSRETNRSHVIYGVGFSYLNTPANGVLQIQSPSGTTVFSQDVTAAGAGFYPFEQGLKFAKGNDVTISLTNGNSSKKISIMGRRME